MVCALFEELLVVFWSRLIYLHVIFPLFQKCNLGFGKQGNSCLYGVNLKQIYFKVLFFSTIYNMSQSINDCPCLMVCLTCYALLANDMMQTIS